MADWQAARLIPTSGIRSSAEAEARATSALLAVIGAVRPFSKALLSPLGATRADKATVEAFIEVPHLNASGRKVRPDGLIRASYGRQKPWVALVEVKTGTDTLRSDQVNEYWDIARAEGYDCVITISNQIAPSPGAHPVEGLRVRANSPVKVFHWSWTLILTEAVKQKVHRGVEDPEQAWILGELIRYLEHPASGAMEFDDMGPNWVAVRDGARASRLNVRDGAVTEIAQRWDQLVRFAALRLGSETGSDVQAVVPKDLAAHTRSLVDSLCGEGVVEGAVRVPDTAGPMHVAVDLRSRRVKVWTQVGAPDDRGARARITWLVRQLTQAPDSTEVEAYAKNMRTPLVADLGQLREDPTAVMVSTQNPPGRFRVSARSRMGVGRKSGRSPGFSESVMKAVTDFYEDVLQNITPFQRRAPKRKTPEPDDADQQDLDASWQTYGNYLGVDPQN